MADSIRYIKIGTTNYTIKADYDGEGNKIATTYVKLENGKISEDYLPSYVDDIVEYANMEAFPATGEKGKIYVDTDNNKTYRWSGSEYIEIPTAITVDSELSDTSVNPVLNKVINAALGTKANTTDVYTKNEIDTKVNGKQATLVSGTNIKTINGASILGEGNISTAITIDSELKADSLNPVQNKVINTALDKKVDKVSGKGLSTNDYTTDEKNKLGGIAAGAQVNTVTGVKGSSETSYRVGEINITKDNIGLANVDNTTDLNKPISTATLTALDTKVNKTDISASVTGETLNIVLPQPTNS